MWTNCHIFFCNEFYMNLSLSPKIWQMWMNARPSLGSVKEEIALILLGLLSANAPLDTNLMKCHKNVKVRNLILCSQGKWGRVDRTHQQQACLQISPKSFSLCHPHESVNIIFLPGIICLCAIEPETPCSFFHFYRPKIRGPSESN